MENLLGPPADGNNGAKGIESPAVDCRFLLRLAAVGMAPLLKDCRRNLTSGIRDRWPVGVRQPINYFGPAIVERWLEVLRAQPRGEALAQLVQLATLTAAQCEEEVAPIIEPCDADAADRALGLEYLKSLPLAVRRTLVADPETGKNTIPHNADAISERMLIQLLPTEAPPFPVGSELPGTSYRLDELVGVGGFGAVYKAQNRFEQNQPPRAIKFCLDAALLDSLYRERVILDRLMALGDVPGASRIVRLYGYALDAQPPFLVYEFVPGGDLTHHLATVRQKTGRGLSPETAVDLIRQVTEGLACAHGLGLVHRDLKPANVLMSGAAVKLTDFGIGGVMAKQAIRGGQTTASVATLGSVADQARVFRGSGTPLYMSPEQRRGDAPDARHDLYSLGVMWYQLLVGDVSRELHPGWPDELTEEFNVPAAHIEVLQRCVGYFKKRPRDARELLTLLAEASALSSPVRTTATQREFDQLRHRLVELIEQDNLAGARQTATAILAFKPSDSVTLEVMSFLEKCQKAAATEAHVFTGHRGWVRGVAVTPDGRLGVSGGDDKTVRILDLHGKKEAACLDGHTGAVMGVALSADGRRAATAGWDGTVRIWDVAGGRELRVWTGGWKGVKCVAMTTDGRRVFAGCNDHRIRAWDADSGQCLFELPGHEDLVQCLALSPDQQLLASGGDDGTIRLWDASKGQESRRLFGHAESATSVAFSPSGEWLLSGSSDKSARLWQISHRCEIARFAGHGNWVNAVAFVPDGQHVLTAGGGEIVNGQFREGKDHSVRVWEVASGKEIHRFEGHTSPVTALSIAADGSRVLSGSLDKKVRLLQFSV